MLTLLRTFSLSCWGCARSFLCPSSPVPLSWCVSTVQELSIGSCCEFRVENAPEVWEQSSLHCFPICCQVKYELSIGRHKYYLLCTSPRWPCCVFSVRCYGQSLSLRLNPQRSSAPELWSASRSHCCIVSAYPPSADPTGDVLWGKVYYNWWAENVAIYLCPSWHKICRANLVKHSSDLHGAAVSLGLKGARFALISVQAWGNVLQMSCKMNNSQWLSVMQLVLQVSHGNSEFSHTLIVNTLTLCRAPGVGRAWKRPVRVSFLLAGIPLIKPGYARAGIKDLRCLIGFIQGLYKDLDALKTRVLAFIHE